MKNEYESLNVHNTIGNDNHNSQYIDYKNNFEAAKEQERREAVKNINIHNQSNNNVLHDSLNKPLNKRNLSANALKNRVNSNNSKNNSSNSRMTNQLASKGLQAVGVPKGLSNAVVNSKVGQKAIQDSKKKNPALNALDKLTGGEKNENEEQQPTQGFVNFQIPAKVKQWLLIASPAVIGVVIFICVFMTASQIIRNVVGLDNANKSSAEINDTMNSTSDEEISEEMNDEDVAYNITIQKKEYAIPYSLVNSNVSPVKRTVNNGLDLSDLQDHYGSNVDSETIKKFYFKLHDIYTRYSLKLGVYLDMPLIMSTLMIQSKDMNIIFKSNTSESYDRTNIETVQNHILDYDYDWSGYKITTDNSAHDIEILAQNMVSVDSSGKYKIDYDKYDEFLKEFLEKKYFIKGGGIYNGKPEEGISNTIKDGNYVEGVTYTDSQFGQITYFNQGDYKKYYYSSDPSKAQYYQGGKAATISSHGCGPTSLSIVASSMLNKQITPIEVTSKVCAAKGCTSSGSKYQSLVQVGKDYGINVTTTSNNQDVINALSTNNSLVIVLMGPGTFTRGGHFIVLTGANSSGQVSVADPASRARTEKKWFSFNTVVEQRKTYAPYMIFSR